jgi:hypothetical protein
VDTVNLDFILGEDVTHVHSRLSLVPNYDVASGAVPELVLNGRKDVKLVSLKVGREAKGWWEHSCASQAHTWRRHLLLPFQYLHASCWALGRAVGHKSSGCHLGVCWSLATVCWLPSTVHVQINGEAAAPSSYSVDDKHQLVLTGLPSGGVTLEVVTEIKPQENSLLEGLYKSGGNFCTQVWLVDIYSGHADLCGVLLAVVRRLDGDYNWWMASMLDVHAFQEDKAACGVVSCRCCCSARLRASGASRFSWTARTSWPSTLRV